MQNKSFWFPYCSDARWLMSQNWKAQQARKESLWKELEIYADWLPVWHLFAALFSLFWQLWTRWTSPWKWRPVKRRCFWFLQRYGRTLSFSLSFNIAVAIFFFLCTDQNWQVTFGDWLEHLNKDFPCYVIESNINSVYQGIHGREMSRQWSKCYVYQKPAMYFVAGHQECCLSFS